MAVPYPADLLTCLQLTQDYLFLFLIRSNSLVLKAWHMESIRIDRKIYWKTKVTRQDCNMGRKQLTILPSVHWAKIPCHCSHLEFLSENKFLSPPVSLKSITSLIIGLLLSSLIFHGSSDFGTLIILSAKPDIIIVEIVSAPFIIYNLTMEALFPSSGSK